ncbi:MAG: HAMP domain-containing histidine kinase [Sphingobacteriales bacterium]|nr:MAG: HAMP domain-containing histidine kinase [Sphingobacteriales bacterium]
MQKLKKLLSIGIQPGMFYRERRKISVINIAGLIGGFSSMIFMVKNYDNGLIDLAVLNGVTMLAGFSVLYFNFKHYYTYPVVIVGLIYSLSCATSAMMYNNNMEFYLLLFMGIYFVLLNDYLTLILFSLVNAVLFLFVFSNPHYLSAYPAVSELHRFIVLLNGILLFLFFLYYFKKQTLNHQQQIEEQNKKLVLLNKNKEKLFAILAHDIRGPINSAGAAFAMVQNKMISKEEFEEISLKLNQQISNVRENVDTLLMWSQSQLNGIKVTKTTVSLKPLVLKLITSFEILLESKELTMVTTDLPDLKIYADEDHIEIILRNLLSNAIKFSFPKGNIMISAAPKDNCAEISIQDFGTGISSENAAIILQSHSFYSSYGTLNEKGTGLGLKFCSEFAEKNGGRIYLKSKEGEGSCFTLRVPLSESAI